MESHDFPKEQIIPREGGKLPKKPIDVAVEILESSEISAEQKKKPENFTEFKQEENVVVDRFFKKTGKALSRATLALSLFIGASSAYGQDLEKDAKSDEAIVQKAEDGSTSTIERLMSRMTITLGGTHEQQTPFNGETFNEVYNYKPLTETKFYNKLSQEQFREVDESYFSAIASKDAYAYFSTKRALNEIKYKTPFDGMQKDLLLQRIGAELYFKYNADMLARGERVKISENDMLNSLKNKDDKSGICGNIATFVTKTARSLGYDAWLQSTMHKSGGHAVTGLVLDNGNLAFFDGSHFLDTDTKNYKKALGVLDKMNERVSLWSYTQLS
ncbi:MAG: hypothetical protein AAB920_01075 [Patescibacteria group bacterium]